MEQIHVWLDTILKDLWLEMELLIGTLMYHQVSHLLHTTLILFQRKCMMTIPNLAAKFSSMISNQELELIKMNALNYGAKLSMEILSQVVSTT